METIRNQRGQRVRLGGRTVAGTVAVDKAYFTRLFGI